MNEKLLHFIWKFGLFDQKELRTAGNEAIKIVQVGQHNHDAGADFQNAKIRIGGTLWAGNVELHVSSADWFNHKHESDKAYNNIVLHVVYEQKGKTAQRENGEPVPTLELKSRINAGTLSRFEELAEKKDWIPCARFFPQADGFIVDNFLESLLVERLAAKVEQVNLLLKESENDWEQVMFQMIARYLGTSINKEAFLMLARCLPVKIWAKHQNDLLQTEALVFGQAGFLIDKFDDDYPNALRKEYNYLRRLYQLQPMEKHLWKFLRLRPSNFPTIRLAQLAALMHKEVKLFSQIIAGENATAIHQLFDVEASAYWKEHYQFDKLSKRAEPHLGKTMKDILMINAVAPVLFAYGKYKAKENYCDKAIQLLQSCKPETNHVLSGWKKLNRVGANAAETQALLQLKLEYCDKFRCLECAIGHQILK